ncbi:MAG: SDR family oxidoreductase [Acidobacteriia bacterium]|jgi:long-chain acyl-CoA synthetase|nr:SDR family oxidoreductase [Terriglobia bacterium]
MAAAHSDVSPAVHAAPEEPDRLIFWRVEGSLIHLRAVRAVGFFTWNAQSFLERWLRRGGLLLLALLRPLFYVLHRRAATRVLHMLLRGVSRDRLDLLGEEYFQYKMRPRLNPRAVALLRERLAAGDRIVLVSQGLEHIMRPLAQHLGVRHLICNRLEFRDGIATGRLLDPVIRPRGGLAWLLNRNPDGRVTPERLLRALGFADRPELLSDSIRRAERFRPRLRRRLIEFGRRQETHPLSVRAALRGKQVLLIGVTGFIGKVWLVKLLNDVPEIGRIFVLIRPRRNASALERFERIVAESPVFAGLSEVYGERLPDFLAARVEVLEGDVSRPGLGLDAATRARLQAQLDLVVNSAGLTDFNPDLRDALETNVAGVAHLLEFVRGCDHAALLHLSTCYVVGHRDGRIPEVLTPDYTPSPRPGFDARAEWQVLEQMVRETVARSESEAVTAELKQQALARMRGRRTEPATLEEHVRRYRARWLRAELVEAGMRRAQLYGWPNTYTFTKSLGESLIARALAEAAAAGRPLSVAVVRPSIVESSLAEPFRGWNEGVGTSAPLAYLLGTYFRQLPSNERKCLDVIPVDLVARGMTLIAAALLERRHHTVYQLATSVRNPCTMGRAIELTGLAHRKHYRAQEGLEAWLRSRFDTIAVSKARYRNLSAPRQKRILSTVNRLLQPLPWKPQGLLRRERNLERVEKIIELYEPFILHNDHVFEADHIEQLAGALVADEQERFGYDPTGLDWWEYWIDIHVPALRRWCYPLIEGRPLELPARRSFRWPVTAAKSSSGDVAASASP